MQLPGVEASPTPHPRGPLLFARQVRYKVTVATSGTQGASTDAPIRLQLFGPRGLLGGGAVIELANEHQRVRRQTGGCYCTRSVTCNTSWGGIWHLHNGVDTCHTTSHPLCPHAPPLPQFEVDCADEFWLELPADSDCGAPLQQVRPRASPPATTWHVLNAQRTP